MRRAFVLLVLLLLFLACSPLLTTERDIANEPPAGVVAKRVPVWIDAEFSTEHRRAIHSALAAWNNSLNGYERFEVVSDVFNLDVDILKTILSTRQGLLILRRLYNETFWGLPAGTLAWVYREDGEEGLLLNIVDDVIGDMNLQTIVQHELGHVLMLPHLPIQNTVMYPTYKYSSHCIDKITIRALASIRGWDWNHMRMCER